MNAIDTNHRRNDLHMEEKYPILVWPVTASHAEGHEARMVLAAAKRVQEHLNQRPTALIFPFERNDHDDVLAYNHVPPKRVFTIKTQYKFIGRMKPRQFSLDE